MPDQNLHVLEARFAAATVALAGWQRGRVLPDDASAAAAEPLFAAVGDLAERIMAERTETIGDLAVQARVAAYLHSEIDERSPAGHAVVTVFQGVLSLAGPGKL